MRWPGVIPTVVAEFDPDHETSPYVIAVHRRRPRFSVGDTVRVLILDRFVTGAVADIAPLKLHRRTAWHISVQIRPLPEGSDVVCICWPGEIDEQCIYHLLHPDTEERP